METKDALSLCSNLEEQQMQQIKIKQKKVAWESVKKSIDKRALHKREYDSWVNERQIQTIEEKDTSSRSGNNAHADDAYIIPIYDEEPMAEVQTTAEINVFAIGQQHTEQPEFNNK
ncbi:hypothetical protein Tco_1288388 [Tanacetum coccineum]